MPTRAERLGFRVQPCSTCARPMFFAQGPNGKPIPLDAKAVVYTADLVQVTGKSGGVETVPACEPVEDAFVSHFATCPDASKHSRGGKR